jgi:zinc transport system substrate-binding protein
MPRSLLPGLFLEPTSAREYHSTAVGPIFVGGAGVQWEPWKGTVEMKPGLVLFAFLTVIFLLMGAPLEAAEGADAGSRVDCWVSILPQAFLVKSVGGDRVNVRVMVGPGQAPHTYEPTARQLSDLASARLYFSVGVAFEEALIPRIERNFRSVEIVDMTPGVARRSVSESETHGHGADDPHVWLSPRMAAIMARNTANALAAADPDGAEIYRNNSRALETELERVDEEIAALLQPYRGREIFVFHPAYGYFTDAYGLSQTAIEENGAAPGPRHLAEVIDRAREQGAKAVFIQPQVSASYAATVAKAIGAKLVTLDPLAEDYIENLRKMARDIATGLDKPRSQ